MAVRFDKKYDEAMKETKREQFFQESFDKAQK
jgi:hypothetical protein